MNLKKSDTKQADDPEVLFPLIGRIGKGSFGEVFKGIHKLTHEVVAVKIINIDCAEDEIQDIQREILLLSQCNSQHITNYYGTYLKKNHLWIVMEYLGGGSCFELLKPGPIEEKYVAIILREVLEGLNYLHSQMIMHRDIKAANLLLSVKGDIKLADFGVATASRKGQTFVGTPCWMAPEVIKQAKYNFKADIWSFGITAIELAKGVPPYADLNPMMVLINIPENEPPKLHGYFSRSFKELVAQALLKEPKDRPNAKQLLEHNFIQKARKTTNLIKLIQRYNEWRFKNRDIDDDYSSSEDENNDLENDDTISWVDTIRYAELSIMQANNSNEEEAEIIKKKLKTRQSIITNNEGKGSIHSGITDSVITDHPYLNGTIIPIIEQISNDRSISQGLMNTICDAFHEAERVCPGISNTLITETLERLKKSSNLQ